MWMCNVAHRGFARFARFSAYGRKSSRQWRLQFSSYLTVLSYDPLVARTRAGRSSYAFTHVSAYGPEFSRHRVATRVCGEGRNHGGLGLRSRGEGIGLRNGSFAQKEEEWTRDYRPNKRKETR